MKALWQGVPFLLLACLARAAEPARLSLIPAPGMLRADLYHVDTVRHPRAVLVLCPGCNADGGGLVSNVLWRAFAERHSLGLVGLSFASRSEHIRDGTGYYYVRNGSGKVLIDGIHRLFGRDLPILLYGVSGGAQFTARFVEWKPERVIAWCAYSAGWWDEPQPSPAMPPGLVVCGESDERLGASLTYFKQGRAAGKPWLWISVANNGHWPDARAESFVRDYFRAVLDMRQGAMPAATGVWVDIDTHREAGEATVRDYPSVTGWLPDTRLLGCWRSLMGP